MAWASLAKFAAPVLGGLFGGGAANRDAELKARMDRDRNTILAEDQFQKALLARDENTRQQKRSAMNDVNMAEWYAKGGRANSGFNKLLRNPRSETELRPNEGQMFAADRLRNEGMDRLVHGDAIRREAGAVTRPSITTDEQFNKLTKDDPWWKKLLGIAGPILAQEGANMLSERENRLPGRELPGGGMGQGPVDIGSGNMGGNMGPIADLPEIDDRFDMGSPIGTNIGSRGLPGGGMGQGPVDIGGGMSDEDLFELLNGRG